MKYKFDPEEIKSILAKISEVRKVNFQLAKYIKKMGLYTYVIDSIVTRQCRSIEELEQKLTKKNNSPKKKK